MKIEDLEMKFAKYKITKFEIIIPGYTDPYILDEAHIGNFTIEKDYEEYVFPYLEFRISVPEEIYKAINKYSEDILVDLKVEYGLYEDMYEMEPEDVLYSFGTIIEGRFATLLNNKTPRLTDSTYGERQLSESEEEGEFSNDAYDNVKPMGILLYKSDHLHNTNQIINTVLQNVTTIDAIAYILTEMGIKDVLMSPAQNHQRYTQMILPPIKGISSILRILRTYGVHDAGSILFFDYDMVYILDKALGATAWINNEYKTTYLVSFPGEGDGATIKSGFYANSYEKYSAISIVGNQISVTNNAVFLDQAYGSNVVTIDSNSGAVTTESSDLAISKEAVAKSGAINEVVMVDTGSGTTKMANTQMEQSQLSMSITVENVNIRALSPNKDFIFTTDNPNYTSLCGHYRITKASTEFNKEGKMYSALTCASFVGGGKGH